MMSKKPNEIRWSIHRIRKSPAELVGWATAKDPESALRKYLTEGSVTDPQEVKRLTPFGTAELSGRRLQSSHAENLMGCTLEAQERPAGARRRGENGSMKRRYIYQGRELTDADLVQIKAAVQSFDSIEHMDDEMRAIAESEWPELMAAKTGARPSAHH